MSEKNVSPEIAHRIKELRVVLGLSQGAFAQLFFSRDGERVKPQSVSKWENGVASPSAENYARMGNMAPPEMRLWFWAHAGIDVSLLSSNRPAKSLPVPPKRHRGPHGGAERERAQPPPTPPEVIMVPLLRDAQSISPLATTDTSLIEDYVIARAQDLPHRNETVAIRAPDCVMGPVVEEGYILIVDLHDRGRETLKDEMVVVRDPGGIVTIRRLLRSDEYFLLRAGRNNAQFKEIILDSKTKWRIVGRVVFWIGSTSRYQKEGIAYPTKGMKVVG